MRKVRSGLIFVIAFAVGALVAMAALIVFLAIVVPA
jgi:ABC-type cobalamin transport system permease subunit